MLAGSRTSILEGPVTARAASQAVFRRLSAHSMQMQAMLLESMATKMSSLAKLLGSSARHLDVRNRQAQNRLMKEKEKTTDLPRLLQKYVTVAEWAPPAVRGLVTQTLGLGSGLL